MDNSCAFWNHYNHSLNVLTRYAASENKTGRYPWRHNDIQSGVLERLHLDYLLAHDPRLIPLSITALPEVSPENLDALDAIFARFRPNPHHTHDEKKTTTKDDWCHAFITGII
jgi:hypothetical protein